MKTGILLSLVLSIGLFAAGCGGGSSGGKHESTSPSATNDGSGGGGGTGGGGTIPPPGPLTFRILESGMGSAITLPELAVARDAAEYSQLWARHSPPMPPGIGAPDRAPPAVDFTSEIVVGIFLGWKSTSGYLANVLVVEPEGDGATVVWEEVQPGPTCPVLTVTTNPFVLVAITRVDGAVTFDGSIRTSTCP